MSKKKGVDLGHISFGLTVLIA